MTRGRGCSLTVARLYRQDKHNHLVVLYGEFIHGNTRVFEVCKDAARIKDLASLSFGYCVGLLKILM